MTQPEIWILVAALCAIIVASLVAFGAGKAAGRRAERRVLGQRTLEAMADASGDPAPSVRESENPWGQPSSSKTPRVALVINPSKNDADRALKQVRLACALRGWGAPLVLETTVEDAGAGQTKNALKHGATLILCAGGDGTVREIASVLSDSEENPDHIPLGILPLGTGNLLARNLGIEVSRLDPTALDAAIDAALEGRRRRIDTAAIEIEDEHGVRREDTFLVMGGIGLDAEVIAATNDDLKKRFGWLAYTDAGIRLLPGDRKMVEVSLDGGPFHRTKIRSILFANLGKLPTGLDFVPGAAVDDGQLSIVTMSPRSVAGWAWIAAKTISRYKADIPVMKYEYATKIAVRSEEPMGTQLDGDLSGKAVYLEAHILPRSLTVHVPKRTPTFLERLATSPEKESESEPAA